MCPAYSNRLSVTREALTAYRSRETVPLTARYPAPLTSQLISAMDILTAECGAVEGYELEEMNKKKT